MSRQTTGRVSEPSNKRFKHDLKLPFTFFRYRQVLILLSQLDNNTGFSVSHKLTHRLSSTTGQDMLGWTSAKDKHSPGLARNVKNLHEARPMV